MAFSAIDPDGVLAASAATAASAALLAEQAAAIQAEIDAVAHLVPGGPAVRGRTTPVMGDLVELSGWARTVALKYVDDEKPVRELISRGFWLPDFSKLGWDDKQSAGQNLDKTLRSDEFGAFILGLGGAMLARYRNFPLLLPKPGVPTPKIPEPDLVIDDVPGLKGTKWVNTVPGNRAMNLILPQGGPGDSTKAQILKDAKSTYQKNGPSLVEDVTFGRPPTWAKVGGRALGAAGTALTLYDSYRGQWEQDTKYHPEWSTEKRVANASAIMATEGGGAVIGGLYGAQLGAAAGTFIPIPVVGTVAGALVGGAVGSFAGSKVGKAGGRLGREAVEYVWDLGKSKWKGLF
ncbi:MAG: hypothetical protein QG608_723 [Actinomycetota bacterium]|nr:hypothetical protein [Actinomycetota bacterium]